MPGRLEPLLGGSGQADASRFRVFAESDGPSFVEKLMRLHYPRRYAAATT